MKIGVMAIWIKFILFLVFFGSASITAAGDITLNGDEILLIENTTYTNKGNITLYDNSQLIIRNSTFNFEQDYHEQYQITLHSSSSLEIDNSTLTSSQRFLVPLFGNSKATVNSSVTLNEASGWKRGAIFEPNDNSTFSCNYSDLDCVGQMHSYSASTKATISIQNSTMQALAFHFPLNSSVNLQDFQKGLIQDFQLLKSNTNLPYDFLISNTTIENEVNVWVKDNSQSVFTSCELHQVAIDDQASVSFVDSKVETLVPRFNGVTAELDNLDVGSVDSLTLDLSGNHSFILNVSNSYIGGYYIRIHSGSNIQINNSHIKILRPDGDSITTINNSAIDETWFWCFQGTIFFNNTIVGNWADTRKYPSGQGCENNFFIKGTVTFNKADLIRESMGNQWFDTIVRREFPCLVQISNPDLAKVEVLDPNGNLAFSGNPDADGNILFQLTFDKATYDKRWKLRLLQDSKIVDEHELRISSATPIILDNQPPSFARPLPDTGQTKCYDNGGEITCPEPGEAFYGQDGKFLINPPSYTKLGASGNDLPNTATEWVMVRDNVTGLIWEVKTDDGSVHDKDNEYDWQGAQDVFIEQVNSEKFGGHSDWRLPTIQELSSIAALGQYDPTVNEEYFPNTVSSYYWSSTTYASSTRNAWYVNFRYGYVSYDGKNLSFYVRAVRGGQAGSLDHLVINGDGTVTDTATGLMWQQATMGPADWQSALGSCQESTLGGYGDWRLPNQRELQSIVDYTVYLPAINESYFPNTVSYYWSSTTIASYTSLAWSVNFGYGYDDDGNKNNYYYVRAVRGGQDWLLGHLFISAPSQGSLWKGGDIMPIRWETAGIGGNVRIAVSRQGGKAGTFETIIGSTENDGAYDWTVEGEQSFNCVLKIEPANDPTKGTAQGLFSIEAGGSICTPDIKANDSDGPITVTPTDPVSIDISLNPGKYVGFKADWWIAVKTPFDPPRGLVHLCASPWMVAGNQFVRSDRAI